MSPSVPLWREKTRKEAVATVDRGVCMHVFCTLGCTVQLKHDKNILTLNADDEQLRTGISYKLAVTYQDVSTLWITHHTYNFFFNFNFNFVGGGLIKKFSAFIGTKMFVSMFSKTTTRPHSEQYNTVHTFTPSFFKAHPHLAGRLYSLKLY
jgi:hypothetical protein